MKALKILLPAALVLASVSATATTVPSFSDSFQCSLWIRDYSNTVEPQTLDEMKMQQWIEHFGSIYSYKNRICNNNSCTAYWYMDENKKTGSGGCALVGSNYWNQAATDLQKQIDNLENHQTLIPAYSYGFVQRNIPSNQKEDIHAAELVSVPYPI